MYRYDFSNAVRVSEDGVREYHKKALEYMVRNKKAPYYFIATGKMVVFATRFDDGMITIWEVSDGYVSTEYDSRKEAKKKLKKNNYGC